MRLALGAVHVIIPVSELVADYTRFGSAIGLSAPRFGRAQTSMQGVKHHDELRHASYGENRLNADI